MEQDDGLKAAIAAVVGKNSTPAQQSKLLLAIVAELAGGLDEILNVVARKVTQYHKKQNGVAGASNPFSMEEDEDKHVININDDDDINGYTKRNNDSDCDDSEEDTGDEYYDDDEPHTSRSRSPAVKRETDALPAFSLRSLIENDKRQNKRQPERPGSASFPMTMTDSTPPPPVIKKRTRSVAGDGLVGSPSVAGSATKKLKSGKDIGK